jgi:signal transduction histidine kinase
MLSEFVSANRAAIVATCRVRVASRMSPLPTELELEHGIPLFLDQLAAKLRSKVSNLAHDEHVGASATEHGSELLRMGFTVEQVVRDYGDVCQSITALAIDRGVGITTEDFRTLNLCLDDAIANAVTEYVRQREIAVVAADAKRAAVDLGSFAHEVRNLLQTASLAYAALQSGNVGVAGSTGLLLGRSLADLAELVERSLSGVRAGMGASAVSPVRIVVADLVDEVLVPARMNAKAMGHRVTAEVCDEDAEVIGDRSMLTAICANLMQNAFKYSRMGSEIVLRTSATRELVRIEIEDECGGLPRGAVATMFEPFSQHSLDRTGLGLGLAICLRGTETLGGTLRVRDLPGKGCVFTVELPRASSTIA